MAGRKIKVNTSSGCDNVLCPFFWGFSTFDIRCEGIVEGSRIILTFKHKEERVQQMRLFCEKQWQCCEITRMLMEAKYGGDDDDE